MSASVDRARAVTESRATTFALACRLLPEDVRDDVYVLYLTLRTIDDLVDEHEPAASDRVAALAAWAAGEAGPVTAETQVLDRLSAVYPLPRDAVADFCRGMEHDLTGHRLATERDLDRYCYQVGGTVGVLMAAILGSTEPEAARDAAAALGMAMQRTNILRDIDEDAAAGRVYISDEALARSGGSLAPGRRAALLREQIARADEFYEDGLLGIPTLRRGRAAITLAARLHREILREIERGGLGRSPGRAVVGPGRRLATAVGAVVSPR